MRFVRFDDDRLGLLTADGIVDLTDRLGLDSHDPLLEYVRGDHDATEYADADPDYDRESVTLNAPVRRPGKVIAAPLNYENHIEEALADRDITTEEWFSIEDKGYFLKAPSSVVGPDHGVELPFSDRRVDHEIELAFLVDEDVKDVAAEDAWEHIFGYTVLLDISVRGDQDRSNRKSYDTFTVTGPCVTTADEIDDPQDLEMELQLNGETRQQENTGNDDTDDGRRTYSCPFFSTSTSSKRTSRSSTSTLIEPTFSMSASIVSPSESELTPSGVPVVMTSPASSVVPMEA